MVSKLTYELLKSCDQHAQEADGLAGAGVLGHWGHTKIQICHKSVSPTQKPVIRMPKKKY